jgi:EAL domain-containing protein (putative c-di-GMP-specific phosphodiesterase class I)
MVSRLPQLIYPVYQAVVDLNGAAVYYEASMRAYGQRSRDGHTRLLAVAEEMGFVDAVDCAICEQAIDAALSAAAPVGVNVSAFTVQNALEDFVHASRRARSVPGGLVIELTETVQPDRMDLMEQFMAEIRRLGARLAIDDYGDGHFEPSDVELMRPDFLKLAMSRVQGAMLSQAGRRWLLEAIAIGQGVGAQIIAEGVETEAMLGFLRQLGVRLFQGYHWGMPSHLLPRQRSSPRLEIAATRPVSIPAYQATPLA